MPTIFHPILDGYVGQQAGSSEDNAWDIVRGGVGDYSNDDGESFSAGRIRCAAVTGWKWYQFHRGILLFDISSFEEEITSAKLTFCGPPVYKNNTFSSLSPTVNVFQSAPASNNALVPGDYDCLGTTPLATAISYNDWIGNSAERNEFIFNAAGIALLQVAQAGDGKVKLGTREATYEAPDNEPNYEADKILWFAACSIEAGTFPYDRRPKLILNYEGQPGYIWVELTKLHYIDASSAERAFEGTDTGNNGTAGYLWVEGTYLHYIDSNGDERRQEGTKEGATGKTSGQLWIEGTKLRYIDSSGDERYIEGDVV